MNLIESCQEIMRKKNQQATYDFQRSLDQDTVSPLSFLSSIMKNVHRIIESNQNEAFEELQSAIQVQDSYQRASYRRRNQKTFPLFQSALESIRSKQDEAKEQLQRKNVEIQDRIAEENDQWNRYQQPILLPPSPKKNTYQKNYDIPLLQIESQAYPYSPKEIKLEKKMSNLGFNLKEQQTEERFIPYKQQQSFSKNQQKYESREEDSILQKEMEVNQNAKKQNSVIQMEENMADQKSPRQSSIDGGQQGSILKKKKANKYKIRRLHKMNPQAQLQALKRKKSQAIKKMDDNIEFLRMIRGQKVNLMPKEWKQEPNNNVDQLSTSAKIEHKKRPDYLQYSILREKNMMYGQSSKNLQSSNIFPKEVTSRKKRGQMSKPKPYNIYNIHQKDNELFINK